jgi:hypothetical protein
MLSKHMFSTRLASLRTLTLQESISMNIYTSNKHKIPSQKSYINKAGQIRTNSQFGTCWIRHDLYGNKKIQKDLLSQYTEQGWVKGRINRPAVDNRKPKYTKISQCTNCNKFFPRKSNNITCSRECAKISSTRKLKSRERANRVDKRPPLMTGAIHPTYLYIKQHSVTKLKYFGKTCQDPLKYKGSGIRWQDHCKKHGKEYIITTHLFGPFTDAADISEFALFFSEEFDIVASKDWANAEPENGLNGGARGVICAVDNNGNTFQTSTSDPRFESGELQYTGSNNVTVKDSFGKIFVVKTDNPLYLDGSLKHILYDYEFRPDMVRCKSHVNAETITIPKSEFYNDPNLFSNRHNKLNVINTKTKERKDVSKEEYSLIDRRVWVMNNVRGYYHTPYGMFTSSRQLGVGNLLVWCKNPDKVINQSAINASKLLKQDSLGMTYRQLGYWFEPL